MFKLKNKYFVGICIFFISTSMIGCATIFKGSSADIRVDSQPSGASVYINGIDKGSTPQSLSLGRDEDHVLTFQKDGYEDVVVEVKKQFDGATTILGNIVSFALIGIVVDVATGAAYSLEPADVQANLNQMENAGLIDKIPENNKNGITVIMLTKEEWAKIKTAK
jgi:hypothetical protein